MNRAWIPAGALAGVSVAGLIALGALTDSLGTPVPFQTSVEVTTQSSAPSKSVPVSYKEGKVGTTTTANLTVRGGPAVSITPDTSGGAGYAGYRKVTPKNPVVTPESPVVTPPAKTTATKPPPRRTSVGTIGAPNSSSGLAGGGSGGTTGSGEQSGTPGSDGR